ncbi:MAG: c-type cytochrome [Burkholderiaceae bacterium]|nr:c-type cytochrome [Burkholderiaceae bacterium]
MSRFRELRLAALMLAVAAVAHAQEKFPGVGRAATSAEVKAWDIDVRADFTGLPKGAGSVAKGMAIWEGKCASCHGVFGESNEVFGALVGGTTEQDSKTGRVAGLQRSDYPGRTTLMKVPTVSTLWDYINRAMPWNAPKSLSTEEVYAVTAYLLNLGRIIPDDFVLSDRNIADVQKRMPNRDGMTSAHAMWPGNEFKGAARPDVVASACMAHCPVDAKVTSALPDHARNAHGNLAEQNRLVGPQRGADTGRALAAAPAQPQLAAQVIAPASGRMPTDLLQKNTCTACHAPDRKLIGPSWNDIAKKHAGKADYIAAKIRTGGSGVWGAIPMPPQTIDAAEVGKIADWLAGGAAP